MTCWSDQTLHWAARQLMSSGADARAVLRAEAPLPQACPPSLAETLEHIRSCRSCAMTALDLLSAELELLTIEEAEQVVALVATPSWSPQPDAGEADNSEPQEYAVAADSPGGGERISLDGHGAISLASRDGSYLVRIFRNEGGAGATAVLLRTQEPDDSEDNKTCPGISLSIDGMDYSFDADGTARLPAFPASPPSLILRAR